MPSSPAGRGYSSIPASSCGPRTPNQLIGVIAHETGHIAGGHLARQQEELRNLSTLQILEMLIGGAAMAGSAISGGASGPAAGPDRNRQCAGTGINSHLPAIFTSAGILRRPGCDHLHGPRPHVAQGPGTVHAHSRAPGTLDDRPARTLTLPTTRSQPIASRCSRKRQRVRRTPTCRTRRNSPSSITGWSPSSWASWPPDAALQRYSEADRSVGARYARAIALYRKGTLGSALLTIDGAAQGTAQRSLFPRAERTDAVRKWAHPGLDRRLPSGRPACPVRQHHEGRFRTHPARGQPARKRPGGPCATSKSPGRPRATALNYGA